MDDQQAREAAAIAVHDAECSCDNPAGHDTVTIDFRRAVANEAIDAYLAALPVAPEQQTQANGEWSGEWDIHPDSVSKLTGATYREVVSDVRRRQSLNDDQAQHAIDKTLFDPPALVSSPSVETVTPEKDMIVREVLDWIDDNWPADGDAIVRSAGRHFGVSS